MDPERFGVVEFDDNFRQAYLAGRKSQTNEVKLGGDRAYFYDSKVVEYAKLVKPSERGELRLPPSTRCTSRRAT